MNILLKKVTRENWEEALNLKVEKQQEKFAPPVAVSLAKVYIKPDGDSVEYIPFAIYDDEVMVGFVMHAFEEGTKDMYWINGFIIDKKYQGKGYGGAALSEMIGWIKSTFPICTEIRLTVYKDNYNARRLYEKFGFQPTGEIWGEEDVLYLPVD
ncbi:GNAT family N-acetyltransferase [Fredinandcohnia humi]